MLTILLWSVSPSAADPALALHQYAHASWRLQGEVKGYPRSLAQTQDGYLWLGTEFGLYQFDGVKFTTWNPSPDIKLPDGAVVKLLGTRDGSLWIGTVKGLARWKDHSLSRFHGLDGRYVAALAEDRKGGVWVGTSAGLDGTAELCSIRPQNISCTSANGTFGRFITALFEDVDGRLWVGAATGLWQWTPVPIHVHLESSVHVEVHSIRGDSSGGILVALNREIRRLNHGAFTAHRAQPTSGHPLKPLVLLEDPDGGTWIGTQDEGIVRIRDGRIDRFTTTEGLSGAFVTDLLEDHEGDIWVATLTGLDRFRKTPVTTISSRDGLSGSVTASVLAASDGAVWIATDAGLDRWKDGRVTHPFAESNLSHDVIGSLLEDSHKRIWASSLKGLFVVENGQVQPIAAFPGGYAHAIVEDARGDIWIADQERGLYRLRNKQIIAVIAPATMDGRIARSLAADPHGDGIWVGFFQGGVTHFKEDRIEASYGPRNGLGAGDVSSLRFDRTGTLWASTQHGLTRLSRDGTATISSANGLPCDFVHWSIEDDSGAIWVYTACGLARIAQAEIAAWISDTKRSVTLTLYGDSDGVTSAFLSDSYGPKVTKSKDGRLWFATLDGIGVLDPGQTSFDPVSPPVHVVHVDVDHRALEPEHNIRFASPVRDLRIDYTALSLSAPEKVRFRYKLEGRDADWIEAGTRRQAFYSDLAPRTYRFLVAVSNNNGVWNQNNATWEFSIVPAFYQTTSFMISLTVCAIGSVALAYRIRLRRFGAQLRARYEERIDERTRIAQDLHDTLLQGFISTSMHLHVLAEELPDGAVRSKLDHILERVRLVIEEGRAAVCELRSTPHASDALEDLLAHDGTHFRGGRLTVHRVVVIGTPLPLDPFVRDEVYRISREALANAFRHSDAKRIDVTVDYAPSRLRVQVCDDGKGLTATALSQSGHWGVRGMRERARRINAEFRIFSRPNGGTEVLLVVPGRIAFDSVSTSLTTRTTGSRSARV